MVCHCHPRYSGIAYHFTTALDAANRNLEGQFGRPVVVRLMNECQMETARAGDLWLSNGVLRRRVFDIEVERL